MQRPLAPGFIAILSTLVWTWSAAVNAGQFQGAWFDVWIPDDFQAAPSLRSATDPDGVESAFFRSADHQVEFYVFSPQWDGEPTDIALDPARERLSASETKDLADTTVTWYTIDALDGSYSRSYQDRRSTLEHTRTVLGVKYMSKAAYARYKDAYLQFKRSLRPFTD